MKTEYPTYLVHFNQNHSSSNGQFISGDGDGDGVVDDHAHRSKGLRKKIKDHYDKKYERAVKRYNTSPAERRQQLEEAKAKEREKLKKTRKKIIADAKEDWNKKDKKDKVLTCLVTAAGIAAVAALGVEIANSYKQYKIDKSGQEAVARAKAWSEQVHANLNNADDSRRANNAKSAGGDW